MKRIVSISVILLILLCANALADCSHRYSAWMVFTRATDSSYGVNYRKCSKCSACEYERYYPEGTLYKGIKNRSEEITALQYALAEKGYNVNKDGFFSLETQNAVKRFQKDNRLEQTGIAYPETLELLGVISIKDPESGYYVDIINRTYFKLQNKNVILSNYQSMLKPDKLHICIDMYNEMLDSLRATHPEVDSYLYYAESSRTLAFDPVEDEISGRLFLKEEVDPVSPSYKIISEELRVDVCNHLEINSVTELLEYYYTTDHHWKYTGSYKAYTECVRMMLGDDVKVIKPSGIYEFPFVFNGSSAKKTGMPVSDEKFTVYTYDDMSSYVSYVNDKKKAYTSSKQYHAGKYTADTYTNHYGLYYGADYAKVLFVNEKSEGGNLLIIGTSFSNAVKTLLTRHYRNIVFIDPRHYKDQYGEVFSVNSAVEEYDIDQLLILCDVNMFSNPSYEIRP